MAESEETDTVGPVDSAEALFDPPPRWRLLELLGQGGQGDVWLAQDVELRQRVAIKVVRSQKRRRRLLRELSIGRELDHPNLVRTYELVENTGAVGVVMEYLPGGSLADRVSRNGALPIDEVLSLGEALLDGLATLHENGIVHRDVKPSNVFLTEDGRPKLGDLGVAFATDRTRLTQTGARVGTPRFMSPEQALGHPPAPPTDLFSLGATLFYCVTGEEPPPTGLRSAGLRSAGLRSASRSIDHRLRELRPDCPGWLRSFLERLLEGDPEHRWPSASEAAEAFRRRRPGIGRRARGALAVLVASVALAGVVAWLVGERSGSGEIVKLEVQGQRMSRVVAVDEGGQGRWTWDSGAVNSRATLFEGYPTPGEEVLIGASRVDGGIHRPFLEIVGRNGQGLREFEMELDWITGVDRRIRPSANVFWLQAVDLDEDGTDEVFWSLVHPQLYPAQFGYWSTAFERPVTPLLTSAGHIREMRAADLDGDGVKEVALLGISNRLGYQTFLALLVPGPSAHWMTPGLLPAVHGGAAGWSGLRSYWLLGPFRSTTVLDSLSSEGAVVDTGGERVVFSVDELLGEAALANRRFWSAAASEGGDLALVEEDHPTLWQRPDMADGAAFVVARRLAENDRAEEAGATLRGRIEAGRNLPRLYRHAGEYLLIAGRLREGLELLRSTPSPEAQEVPVDARVSLALAAIAVDEDVAFAEALAGLSTYGGRGGYANVERQLRLIRDAVHREWVSCSAVPPLAGSDVLFALPLAVDCRYRAGAMTKEEALAELARLEQDWTVRDMARVIAGRIVGERDPIAGLATLREGYESLLDASRQEYQARFQLALAAEIRAELEARGGAVEAARTHQDLAARIIPSLERQRARAAATELD